MVYAVPIPLGFMNYNTANLEILNIVMLQRFWPHIRQTKLFFFCFGDTWQWLRFLPLAGLQYNTILATCNRNLWFIVTMFNIEFIFYHIPGAQNTVTDLFSH